MLSMANRLHTKFKRVILSAGQFYEGMQHWERAVAVYERGLGLDELAEEFSRRLIFCYQHLGRHDDARRYYASALKIAPDEPSVLSNLGLSYVLSKDLPKAEETLRRAFASTKADARVRQNLGLVVGLQGRFAEAESIVKADLPPEEAAANAAYLKQMLSRKDNPRAAAIPVASLNRPD